METIREHEKKLMRLLLSGLNQFPEISVYGPELPEERLGLVSFNINGMDPYVAASQLDERFGIMVRAGLHCAPEAHRLLGTDEIGTVRVSTSYFNTAQHIDLLLEALQEITKRNH